jgi:hypothetical protein
VTSNNLIVKGVASSPEKSLVEQRAPALSVCVTFSIYLSVSIYCIVTVLKYSIYASTESD